MSVSLVSGLSQILILSYLSHRIAPAALGAIAMMNVCIYFATALQDFGIASFQVQLKNLSPSDQTVLLVLNLVQGLLVASILYICIPWIVSFYNMPQLEIMLLWCCVLVLINGLCVVHQSSLIKELRLVTLAKLEMFCKLAGIALTWYLVAQQPDNLNAIILGLIFSALLKTILLWSLKDTRLTFAIPKDFRLIRQAFHYGCWQFGSQQLSLVRAQSDQIIVGKLLGMETLGIYSLAREIIQYPARFTQPVLHRLLLPRFVQLGESNQKLLEKSLYYSLWFHCFIYSILALCSGVIVQMLLPEHYSKVAILLCLFSLGSIVRPNGQILVPFIQANGIVRKELYWNMITTVLWCVSLISLFMFFDFFAAVWISSILQILISLSAFCFLTNRDLQSCFKVFTKISYRPIAITFVFSVIGLMILPF